MDARGVENERVDTQPLDVVVIDDEEMFTEGCRQTLEMGGYRAAVARDGPQGLQLVGALHPSVVLVDLKMHGMDGIEVLRHLSTSDPLAVPIVITGHGTVDSAVESMRIGAIDFLTKPFEPEKLLETVRRGIGINSTRKEAKETAQKAVEAPSPPPDKYDLLLQGLDVLGECYALGLDKRQLLDELAFIETEAKNHAQSLGQVKNKERVILDIRDDLVVADSIMRKYEFQKSALIQVLLDVQERFHWLPRHLLHWIAGRLNVPLRQIYTIADFYDAFSLDPCGRHTVEICTGTACHVRGAPEMLTRLSTRLRLKPGQTDNKRQFTLETAHCLGCCALAPVMLIDGQHYHDPTRKKLDALLKPLEKEEEQTCRA